MGFQKWLLLIRAPFLTLPIALAFLGTSIAWYNGFFHLGHALLAFLGLLLAHISVNVLNEYHDYQSGVDFDTKKTPFSGGSGTLPAGLIKPRQALWLGLGSLLAIVPIGIYFVITSGLDLLWLLLIGAACIVLYTPFILKIGWAEWAPGLGLGTLAILGLYYVQTGEYTQATIFASIPSGILVHNLLLLNELPDIEADRKAGRRSLPIFIGGAKAAAVYSFLTVMVYLWIIVGVATNLMPAFSLLALLTIPLAIKAIRGSLNYQQMDRLVPALASNVMVVLFTQLLMGLGYILARIF
jgi:1,4-dihydroxy-2-naphthoate octaprenyltransferase